MAYKTIIQTALLDAIKGEVEDNIFLSFLLDSRREFVEARLNQESEIENAFKMLEENLLTYLSRVPEQLTEKEQQAILKFVDGITNDLRIDLGKIINDNILKMLEIGGNTYKGIFELITNKVNIERLDNKLFSKAIDKNNKKIYATISNRTWTKKGTGHKLSGRIWKASLYARNGIKDVIKKGVSNGDSTQTIAKNISKYMKPHARKTILVKEKKLGRKTPKNPHYYAMRVARSEIQASYQNAMYDNGKLMPNYTGIIWLLSNRHPKYDICDELAKETKYGQKGFFPEGKEPVLPHPQCICSQVQQFGNLDDFIERLKEWEKNPKNDKELETWYKKYLR